MRRPVALVSALACLLLLTTPPALRDAPAATQADVFDLAGLGIDPSPRALGMGAAGGAVFWGDQPDTWANPALLGYASGVRYAQGTGSIEGDPVYSTHRATIGYGGVGIGLAGQPFRGNDGFVSDFSLDFSDPYGGSQEFILRNRVRSWSAGVSLAGAAVAAARRWHWAVPAIARHVDLAFGFAENVAEETDSADPQFDLRVVTHDAGVLARTGTTMRRADPDAATLRLDAAYGYTLQNTNPDSGRRHHRQALAARAAWLASSGTHAARPAWVTSLLDPLVSLGLAYDHDRVLFGSSPGEFENDNFEGAELGITRVFALQLGQSNTTAHWWGYSINLPVGRIGGASYQHAATRPNADQFHLARDAWSVWLDPLALAGSGR